MFVRVNTNPNIMELTFAYGTSDACSAVSVRERSCYKWDKGIAFHYYFEKKVPLEVFLWLDSSSLTSASGANSSATGFSSSNHLFRPGADLESLGLQHLIHLVLPHILGQS